MKLKFTLRQQYTIKSIKILLNQVNPKLDAAFFSFFVNNMTQNNGGNNGTFL